MDRGQNRGDPAHAFRPVPTQHDPQTRAGQKNTSGLAPASKSQPQKSGEEDAVAIVDYETHARAAIATKRDAKAVATRSNQHEQNRGSGVKEVALKGKVIKDGTHRSRSRSWPEKAQKNPVSTVIASGRRAYRRRGRRSEPGKTKRRMPITNGTNHRTEPGIAPPHRHHHEWDQECDWRCDPCGANPRGEDRRHEEHPLR